MLRETHAFLKQVVWEIVEDDVASVASSLAFWTVLSLAPLALVLVALGGWIGPELQASLVGEVGKLMGEQAGEGLRLVLDNASDEGSARFGWFGGLTWLFSATAVFVQMQYAINRIWGVQTDPQRGLLAWVRKRVLSLAMIAAVGFILAVSLVVSSVVAGFVSWLEWSPALRTAETAGSFVVLVGVFALVYKVVPDVHIGWKDVLIGALITAGLFTVGKMLIGTYLGRSAVGSSYGAAGSVVVLLVWVYYSATVFFIGAEVTQVWASRYGTGIHPDRWAVARPTRDAPAPAEADDERPRGQDVER